MGSLAELTLGRPSSSSIITSYKHGVNNDHLESDIEEHNSYANKIDRIHTYLKLLEDERRKIDAFKRELPICMQLLNSAIETSKEELLDYNHGSDHQTAGANRPDSSESGLVDHEEIFVPLTMKKRSPVQNQANPSGDQTNALNQNGFMSKSKQLKETRFWSPSEAYAHGQEMLASIMTKKPQQMVKRRATNICPSLGESRASCSLSSDAMSNPDLRSPERPRGAFLPFPRKDQHLIKRTSSSSTTTTTIVEGGDNIVLNPPMFSKPYNCRGDDNEAVNMSRVPDNPPSFLTREYSDHNADNATGSADQFEQTSLGEIDEPTPTTSSSLQHHDEINPKELNANHHTNAPIPASRDRGGGGGGTALPNEPSRKRRRCWSSELHRKFVHALQVLGGSEVATPKLIRELMKVDGLTNDEVKSHLQKYRLHTRRPSGERTKTQTPQLVVLGGIWVPPPSQSSSEDPSFAATHSLDRQAVESDQDAMDEGCSWIKGGPYISSQSRKLGLMHLGLHHGEFSYVQNH